jgi:hypothetical protein
VRSATLSTGGVWLVSQLVWQSRSAHPRARPPRHPAGSCPCRPAQSHPRSRRNTTRGSSPEDPRREPRGTLEDRPAPSGQNRAAPGSLGYCIRRQRCVHRRRLRTRRIAGSRTALRDSGGRRRRPIAPRDSYCRRCPVRCRRSRVHRRRWQRRRRRDPARARGESRRPRRLPGAGTRHRHRRPQRPKARRPSPIRPQIHHAPPPASTGTGAQTVPSRWRSTLRRLCTLLLDRCRCWNPRWWSRPVRSRVRGPTRAMPP